MVWITDGSHLVVLFDVKLHRFDSNKRLPFLVTPYIYWSQRAELNRRPTDYESVALPLSYAGLGLFKAWKDVLYTLCPVKINRLVPHHQAWPASRRWQCARDIRPQFLTLQAMPMSYWADPRVIAAGSPAELGLENAPLKALNSMSTDKCMFWWKGMNGRRHWRERVCLDFWSV